MLCDCCQKIRAPHHSFPKAKNEPRQDHQCIVRHHENFAALLESADKGCELCLLFRPFVEHAQLNQQAGVRIAASDCSASEGSEFTYADPFLPETEYGRGTSTDGGSGTGSGYNTDYDGSSRAPSEPELDLTERRPYESEVQTKCDGWEEPEPNREILRWLLRDKAYTSGPEQLWVTGRCVYNEKDPFTQSRAAESIISLSAGSIDGCHIEDNEACYCLDGHWLENRQALAIRAPGLWMWRYRHLKIRAGRKKPLRALPPNFELFQHRENALQLDPPVHGRNIVEDPTSDEALAIIRDWWIGCKESHTTCSTAWESQAQLPTRVIDVGPPSAPLRPYLYQATPDEIQKGVQYATLSHCWGPDTSAITRTVRANLEGMKRGIDMTTLSKNFRDAIKIARGLKIRYLWIDALCIIQDSEDDWARESGQMTKYYRNASITISALTSPNAQHGILFPRLADKQAVQLTSLYGAIFVRPVLSDVISITNSSLHSAGGQKGPELAVEHMPLFQRAWTLQERILSRRMVHFSKQQMIWQCKTCLLSEDGQYSSTEKAGKLVDILNVEWQKKSATPYQLNWHHLVTEFTRRSLSYDSDKLPALSGLAKEVARLTGDKYIAGLWRLKLREELLWETYHDSDNPNPKISRIDNGSPTWAWASIRGSVQNIFLDVQRVRRVPRHYDSCFLNVRVKLATSDPFGRVAGGKICLSIVCHTYSGPEFFSKTRNISDKNRDNHNNQEGLQEPEPSCSQAQDGASWDENVSYTHSESDDFIKSERLDIPNKTYDWVSHPHIIACIGEYNSEWNDDPENKWATQEFLLLRAVGPPEERTYRRVGRASTDGQNQEIRRRFHITEAKGWIRRTITLM